MVFDQTSAAIDVVVMLPRHFLNKRQCLNIHFLEHQKMSKGNSRKGNRETKKPKKETPKVLATASTVLHPIRIETGSKKGK